MLLLSCFKIGSKIINNITFKSHSGNQLLKNNNKPIDKPSLQPNLILRCINKNLIIIGKEKEA